MDFELGLKAVEQTLEEALWSSACTESIFSEDFDSPVDSTMVRGCVRLYVSRYPNTVDSLVHRATVESKDPDSADDVLMSSSTNP